MKVRQGCYGVLTSNQFHFSGNFHNSSWLKGHYHIQNELNIHFLASHFHAPGCGKNACDRAFATMRNHMLKVISYADGTEIISANDLVRAFQTLKGVKDTAVATMDTKDFPQIVTTGKELGSIGSYYSFEYLHEDLENRQKYRIRMRRYFRIGAGQCVTLDNADIEGIENPTHKPVEWVFSQKPSKPILPTEKNPQRHLRLRDISETAQVELEKNERITFDEDLILKYYAASLEVPKQSNKTNKVLAEFLQQEETESLLEKYPDIKLRWESSSQGFGMKTYRTLAKFNEKHRQFLTKIFDEGARTNNKYTAEEALIIMREKRDDQGQRVFSAEEFLIESQVRAFMHRQKTKNVSQSQPGSQPGSQSGSQPVSQPVSQPASQEVHSSQEHMNTNNNDDAEEFGDEEDDLHDCILTDFEDLTDLIRKLENEQEEQREEEERDDLEKEQAQGGEEEKMNEPDEPDEPEEPEEPELEEPEEDLSDMSDMSVGSCGDSGDSGDFEDDQPKLSENAGNPRNKDVHETKMSTQTNSIWGEISASACITCLGGKNLSHKCSNCLANIHVKCASLHQDQILCQNCETILVQDGELAFGSWSEITQLLPLSPSHPVVSVGSIMNELPLFSPPAQDFSFLSRVQLPPWNDQGKCVIEGRATNTKLINTCSIDTVITPLLLKMVTDPEYRILIESSTTPAHKLLKSVYSHFLRKNFFYLRVEWLKSNIPQYVGPIINETYLLDCYASVIELSPLFSHCLQDRLLICSKCCKQEVLWLQQEKQISLHNVAHARTFQQLLEGNFRCQEGELRKHLPGLQMPIPSHTCCGQIMDQSTMLELDTINFLVFDLANVSGAHWKSIADFGEIHIEKYHLEPLAAIYHAVNHFTVDINLNGQTWFYDDKAPKLTQKKRTNDSIIAAVIYTKCLQK